MLCVLDTFRPGSGPGAPPSGPLMAVVWSPEGLPAKLAPGSVPAAGEVVRSLGTGEEDFPRETHFWKDFGTRIRCNPWRARGREDMSNLTVEWARTEVSTTGGVVSGASPRETDTWSIARVPIVGEASPVMTRRS